tara:strand:+ start:133 stop:987 length:855 start_codon:yes stop_codon:yes gene_type:complete
VVWQSKITHPLADSIRETMLDICVSDVPTGIMLSSGVDSNTILAALLRNDIRPTVYSFHVKDHYSTDYRYADNLAKKLKLDFVEVEILKNIDDIIENVRFTMSEFGFRKKADIECSIPMLNVIQTAIGSDVKNIFSGAYGDYFFGTTRKCYIRASQGDGKTNPQWLDEYRDEIWASKDLGQSGRLRIFANKHDIQLTTPYRDPRLAAIFRGSSWGSVNTPMQKMPFRAAFPEIESWKVAKKNQPFQLGDTNIAKSYEQLLKTDLNVGNWKAVIGIYNAIAKGIV